MSETTFDMAQGVRDFAKHHYAPENRHIGEDEYRFLLDAADTIETLGAEADAGKKLAEALRLIGLMMGTLPR